MSSIKFTIYEILGYVAPGIIGLAALLLVTWTAFLPQYPLPIKAYSVSKEGVAVGLFTAYALGHLIQGLCNFHPSAETLAHKRKHHTSLLSGARSGLALRCGFPMNDLDVADVAALAQTALLNTGKMDDFDVFLYREGFYRGSCGAYLLLACALLFRAFHGTAMLQFGGASHLLHRSPLFFGAALSLVFAFVFYRRYLRFGTYRLRHLLSFACFPGDLTPQSKTDDPEKKSSEDKDDAETTDDPE